MAQLEFVIPGRARGKARPRVTKTGHAFTPAETVNAEALVKLTAARALGKRPMLDGPMRCVIEVMVEPPKKPKKELRAALAAGTARPTSRPDLDNIIKLIADGLNGVAYRDDAAIVELHVFRKYGPRAETWVHLSEIGQVLL